MFMYVHGLGDAQEEWARRFDEQYDNTIEAALEKFTKTCKCNKCGEIAADDYYCDDIEEDGHDMATANMFITCYQCGNDMGFELRLYERGGIWKVSRSSQVDG